MAVETVGGTKRVDAPRRYVSQQTEALRAVSEKGVAAKRKVGAGEEGVDFSVRFRCVAAEARHAPNERDCSAERIRAVLRAVWPTQNLNRAQAARLVEVEEGAETAALRGRRVAHAVNKDVDVLPRQSAHEDAAHVCAGDR